MDVGSCLIGMKEGFGSRLVLDRIRVRIGVIAWVTAMPMVSVRASDTFLFVRLLLE